tara:strand:+ start:352 stop:1293 length:942 start_codon:yes stop_codon:yes gene_type:complete
MDNLYKQIEQIRSQYNMNARTDDEIIKQFNLMPNETDASIPIKTRISDGITGANNYITNKFTNFKEGVGNFKNTIGDGIKGILDNTLIGRFGAANDATNPNAFNYNPDLQGQINFMKDQGMYGNNYSSSLPQIQGGVLAGQRLQSLFGSNDLTDMYANQVARSQNTLDMIPERFSRLAASEEKEDIEAYRKKMAINQTRLNEAIAQQQLNFDRQNTMNDAQGYDATGRGRAFDYVGRDNEYGTHRSTITNKNAQINQDAGRGGFNPGSHNTPGGNFSNAEAQSNQDKARGRRFKKGGRVGYFFGGLAARGMKR